MYGKCLPVISQCAVESLHCLVGDGKWFANPPCSFSDYIKLVRLHISPIDVTKDVRAPTPWRKNVWTGHCKLEHTCHTSDNQIVLRHTSTCCIYFQSTTCLCICFYMSIYICITHIHIYICIVHTCQKQTRLPCNQPVSPPSRDRVRPLSLAQPAPGTSGGTTALVFHPSLSLSLPPSGASARSCMKNIDECVYI